MLATQIVALVLAVGSLTAAGCGSSKGGSSSSNSASTGTTSSTPTTPAAFVAQGNIICKHLASQINAITVRSVQGFASALPQVAAYERAAAAEMSKLAPPSSLAASWNRISNDLRQLAENDSTLAQHIGSGENLSSAKTKPLVHIINTTHNGMHSTAVHIGLLECTKV